MSDESYDKAYEAGRSGGMYTGGNSIDYAGYAAGQQMRTSAEASSGGGGGGGGGGGAINFKGKVVLVGLGFGMIGMVLGMLWSDGSTWGAIAGFTVAFLLGATVRLIIAAAAWALPMFGRIFPFVLPIAVGGFLGMCVGAVASDQMHSPRHATMIQFGMAGAAILFALWSLRRRLARKWVE